MDNYFQKLELFGSEQAFNENCVNLEAGDPKP